MAAAMAALSDSACEVALGGIATRSQCVGARRTP